MSSMKCIVCHANEKFEKAITFRDFKTFKNFIDEWNNADIGVIVEPNSFWKDESIFDIMNSLNVDKKFARKISKADYILIIYDDYIE